MKIYITFFLLLPIVLYGQSQSQNYIKTTTYKAAGLGTLSAPTPAQAQVDITYFDGLGRPIQQIASQQSNSGNDIVTPIQYDVFGRQTKEYLPYTASTANGFLQANALNDVVSYYNTSKYENSTRPFSQKVFEASPLERVLKQAAPGNAWAIDSGHEIKFDYQTNIASEVKLYKAATSWNAGSGLYDIAFSDAGSYAANQLYKTVTYDENTASTPTETEGSTVEFKNKDGQVVLKRTYDNTVKHDTYYVYDNNGNLTYVLPPLVSNKLVQGSAPAGYDNFFKSFDQSVFTGIAGTGLLTVSITNNVLNIALNTSVNTSTLLETPQDLPTYPCLLPDMSLGTVLDGKYGAYIVGGKLKFQFDNLLENSGAVEGFHETLTTNLSTSYTNFSTYLGYAVFTGRPGGGGGVTVSITNNNVLKVEFSAGFTKTELVETPQDLATTNMLPDMNLGTILDGKYGVTIIGGKIKLTNLTKIANGLKITANLPNACKALILSVDETLKSDLFYQYKYDSRNRLVEKKLPGKQWEYVVYDKLDRVVATGPALSPFNDSAAGVVGWMITKYDAFNRPIYTGWEQSTTVTSAGRTSKQNTINGLTTLSESKTAVATTIDNLTGVVYYTNNVVPTAFKLLTVNYYDDYTFQAFTPAIAYTAPVAYNNSTLKPKGLPTGSWVRVLTTLASASGESAYVLYDAKARPVRSFSTNYLGGYTRTDSNLDAFSGKLLSTETRHKRLSGDVELYVKDTYTYTAQDRLLTHTHKIGTAGVEQLLSKNEYDELGQLIVKRVGGTDVTGSNSLQKVDYSYNIRGWLKGINDTDASNGSITMESKDLFGFQINYNTPTAGKALYNGNISQTFWKTANSDTSLKNYIYAYDGLNRLTSATDNLGKFNETLSYDKNGNIKTLKRMGEVVGGSTVPDIANSAHFGIMDDLTYDYNGNQLKMVNDNGNDTYGFKDHVVSVAPVTTTDYTYDANGNMLTDANKGITTQITYNHLNLPTKIIFSTGNITYIYNAAGQKVQKSVYITAGAVTTATDYLGGYQYEKINTGTADLKFFPTAEGYVQPNAGSYKYFFQYKDHLGNIRLTYQDKQNDGVVGITDIEEENNYYPFGMKQKGYNFTSSSSSALKYKYNGKELQDDNIGGIQLNLYDYGARNYDPALGRWMNIDPLAEMSRRFSPYTYANNNPLYFIDPDGMSSETYFNDGSQAFADLFNSLKSSLYNGEDDDNDDDPPVYIFGFIKRWENRSHEDQKITSTVYSLISELTDDAFRYFGHGYNNYLTYQGTKENPRRIYADDLDGFLGSTTLSKKWADMKKNGGTFISYGCFNGAPGGLLQTASDIDDLSKIIFVGSADFNYPDVDPSTGRFYSGTKSRPGQWNIYRDGKQVGHRDWNWQPTQIDPVTLLDITEPKSIFSIFK